MRRRFRSRSIVLRKKHLLICVSALLLPAFIFNADIPSLGINPEFMFRSVLLCMDNGDNKRIYDYIDVLKSGNVVFAYSPGTPERIIENVKVTDEAYNSPPEAVPENEPETEAVVQQNHISIPSDGIEMRNQTSFSPDTASLLQMKNDFLPVEMNSSEPQVLIFHTHTTESYYGSDRTDNEEKNVVAVGKVIAEALNERGINTLHCKTVHDYDYNGSYSKSYDTVERLLSENPSVKIVLDVHRDGITYEDGSGLRVIAEINGETTGQFMLVVGTDEGGLYHPGWETNLSFALKIQNRMNEKYPGFARPLNLRSERFNQNLSPGMMIVECGGNGNSLEEVKLGAKLFADTLYDVISQQN